MANWWDAAPIVDPSKEGAKTGNWWDAAPVVEQPSVAADVAKSGGVGIAQGLIGAAGMPADVTNLGRSALGWVGDQTVGRVVNRVRTGEWSPTTAGRESAAAVNQTLEPQTSAGLTRSVERITGPMYEPQTVAGQYARTIGRNIPAAAVGPGGAVARTAMAAVPGVLEETAGQITKGTAAEPYARTAAGILGGVGAAGAARAAERAGFRNQITRMAPTRDELEAAKTAAYDAADNAGVRFSQQAADRLAAATDRRAVGFHPSLEPRTAAASADIQAIRGTTPTLSEVEDLRKIASRAGNTISGEERLMSGRLTSQIDDFFSSAGPRDVVSGDPVAGAALLREARGNTAAMKRSDLIDDALGKAQARAEATHSGMNVDNAIRQRLASLLANPKAMRGFNDAEREAIRSVVRGEASNNALRTVGNVLGGGGGLGMLASGGLLGAAGFAVAGPVGAAVGGALGAGGGRVLKSMANRSTTKGTEALAALIRSRSPAASPDVAALLASNPRDRINRDAIARLLLISPELQQQPSN
jgi:hypothetical protein